MNNKFKKRNTVKKHSNGGTSSGLLKTLQKMIFEKSGTVAFVTEKQKLKNIHTKNHKDFEYEKTKVVQQINLPPTFFKDRSPNDLLHVFDTMKIDLGADRFIAG